jgi:hypothetical protein
MSHWSEYVGPDAGFILKKDRSEPAHTVRTVA